MVGACHRGVSSDQASWKRRIENRARQMYTYPSYVNSARRVPRTVRRTRGLIPRRVT